MALSEKAKEGRKLYMKKWREKNKDKVREYSRNYMRKYRIRQKEKHDKNQNDFWERKADELREDA